MSTQTSYRVMAMIFALLGLLILWQSTVWGLKAAPGIITQLGSVSGDMQYQIIYEGPVVALRIIGGVLFAIGLYRFAFLQK